MVHELYVQATGRTTRSPSTTSYCPLMKNRGVGTNTDSIDMFIDMTALNIAEVNTTVLSLWKSNATSRTHTYLFSIRTRMISPNSAPLVSPQQCTAPSHPMSLPITTNVLKWSSHLTIMHSELMAEWLALSNQCSSPLEIHPAPPEGGETSHTSGGFRRHKHHVQ